MVNEGKVPWEEDRVLDETELEDLVIRYLDQIEKGLIFLDRQKRTEGGRLDILCADSGGSFVILELKIGQDDEMLLQALDYLDYVNENRDWY